MERFSLAPIFGDGMVFQRDKEIVIWGTGVSDAPVTILMGEVSASCVPINGKWKCILPAFSAAEGLTVTVEQCGQTVSLHNVMIGDVWIAAGQSNMEFFLKYEKHRAEALKNVPNKKIRFFTCPRKAYKEYPFTQSGSGFWFQDGDENQQYFSAVGYWFARELQQEIRVPVGILACNWGGTSASAWMPEQALAAPPLNIYLQDYQQAIKDRTPSDLYEESMAGWALQSSPEHLEDWSRVMLGMSRRQQFQRMTRCAGNPVVPMGPYSKNRPGGLYKNMVREISDFPVKGVLWYQGENDVHHSDMYDQLFSALIFSWRRAWHTKLPFLFVQLAPFDRWMALDGKAFPEIRCMQERVSHTVPDCWMTCAMDVGMKYDIHPKEKRTIGHRLALLALDKVYGLPHLSDAPEFSHGERTAQGEITLRFSACGESLYQSGNLAKLFRVHQKAEIKRVLSAEAHGNSVALLVKDLRPGGVHISFAEAPYERVCLYNSADIPAKPFSTFLPES